MLGEARELRKVFFENIRLKKVEDERWYEEILTQILKKMKEGLPIEDLQLQVDEKLFNLYELNTDERNLINSGLYSTY